ncbi:protocatechuate 4,5-dioxygenase, beta chain [Pseudonocardia ammonioxydans]|uniref:Protocatechuate 4,5-dioxygenase, beta chain n=1 Tax=Pseudonocardia ammonioxydans TaxID=260086 RepID=A0A1I5FXH8_PSUAM|nr:hypothetical protein [Pseudonocardia ammonioxydans]SFO28445.1 protocatechuate 4,5-dioxygenase, beta chain [Pseudonocardia ammonioxydans]
MLVQGIGASHTPTILLPLEEWPATYARMRGAVAPPAAAARETPEFIDAARARIDADLATLRERIRAVEPDVVVIVGDDQNEVFGPAVNPTLAVYCGNEVSGETLVAFREKPGLNRRVDLKCAGDFGLFLAKSLIDQGFDPAVMTELRPLSKPEGIGHAFTRPAAFLGLDELGVPVVPVFLNSYHEPLPDGARCYDLGVAIGRAAQERPERVVVVGSGGLSHDPFGVRAGWVDDELDEWVLDRIRVGDTRALRNLFTFPSQTLHGGAGEIRSWITVAGAFENVPADVLDYIPLHHAITGVAFATWTPAEN